MALSNPDTIEVRESVVTDGRKKLKVYELYIDGCRRATVQQRLNGGASFRFHQTGAFDYQEARVWLQGLLELSIYAEELERGKKTSKKG